MAIEQQIHTDKPADTLTDRHLIIRVSESGKPNTNIRIPLKLARLAGKFIPAKEKTNLKEQGIDIDELLAELSGDEIGPLVEVEQEDKTVWIAVE